MHRLTPDRLEHVGQAMRLGAKSASDPIAIAIAAEAPAEDPREIEKQRLEDVFESANERGYQAGLAEAEQEIALRVEQAKTTWEKEHRDAVAALNETQARLAALLRAVPGALADLTSEAEEIAVEAAFAAVVRLLGDKAAERTLMRELCRYLAEERGEAEAVLRISESDAVLLVDTDIGLATEVDRRLRTGQCVIETARGQFDAGLDVRLEAMKQAFLSGLAAHRSPA